MALKITYVACPTSKYHIKCPHTMKPIGITIHNTANNASAMNEISYMLSNNNYTSFHYAVDDTRAVQGIPLNRNAWHAGDGGSGKGNRQTIGIEICYSKSGGAKYDKAFDNALTLVAQLMKQYGFKASQIYYHKNWSGKNCPHRALAEGITIEKFRKLAQDRYNKLYVKQEVKTYKTYKVVKTINGYMNAANAKAKKNAVTKVSAGTYYIYNESNGMKNVSKTKGVAGSWINPSDNVASSTSTSKTSTIKVGDKVGVKKGAKDYNGNSAGGVKRGVVCYRVDELNGKRAVLDKNGICTPFHVDNLFK